MKKEFIDKIYDLALESYKIDEIPVGAIIVRNGKIIAEGINNREKDNSVIGHAEINAIEKACQVVGDWRLDDCEMYVTLEPCPMCASAIQQSRIKKIYIGTSSNIENNKEVILSILNNPQYNHSVDVCYVENMECSQILSSFFENKRH